MKKKTKFPNDPITESYREPDIAYELLAATCMARIPMAAIGLNPSIEP